MTFIGFLNWAGGLSCSLGSLLALVSLLKGREARQLAGATNLDSLGDLHQLVGLVPLLVAVTGRVFADRPLKCELSDGKGAIVELRVERKSERRQNSYWYTDTTPLREQLRETNWWLKDSSGVELPVVVGRRADGDYLQLSGDIWVEAKDSSLLGAVAGQVLGNRTLGTRTVEQYLPLGTVLTAVGELAAVPEATGAFQGALRSAGRMYVLRQPADGGRPFRLSRHPLPELIASLRDTSRQCQQLAVVFSALGASMLAISLTHRVWLWYRQRKIRQRVEKARRERAAAAGAAGSGAAAAGGADAAPDGQGSTSQLQHATCVICLDRECELVFRCGHLCACSTCGSGLRRCPICRQGGAPIRVYVA